MKIINLISLLSAISFVIMLSSCSNNPDGIIPGNDAPNILLIIADDLGKDAINGFTEGSIKPNTPNIDAIRNNGLTFTNFWVNPTCTPVRSPISATAI